MLKRSATSRLPNLLLEALGRPPRRYSIQPFEVARGHAVDRRQQARQPALPLRSRDRGDDPEQDLLLLPAGSVGEAPDVPLAAQELAMLDQPRAARAISSAWSNTAAASRRR